VSETQTIYADTLTCEGYKCQKPIHKLVDVTKNHLTLNTGIEMCFCPIWFISDYTQNAQFCLI
jgi:hypothetical protein